MPLADKLLFDERRSPTPLEARARSVLEADSHFRGRHQLIGIHDAEGALVLTGKLPSFYLKQILQNALRKTPGVQQIENRVEVMASHGLSSSAP